MSNALPRPARSAGGPAQATRQQLDELDALLQRMLDLPVNQAAEEEEDRAAVDEPPVIPPVRPALRIPAPVSAEPPGEPKGKSRVSRNAFPEPEPVEPAPVVMAAPTPPPPPEPVRVAPRSYPASYMVVETTTPTLFGPPPSDAPREPEPPEEFEEPVEDESDYLDTPVPGGRHDLEEDTPEEPAEEPHQGEESAEPDNWVPFRSSWQPSAQTWGPLARSWAQSQQADTPPAEPLPSRAAEMMDMPRSTPPIGPTVTGPAPRPSVLPPVIPPTPISIPEPEPEPATDEMVIPEAPPAPREPPPTAPPRSWAALPFVWFNVLFDCLLFPLGPLGTWFKGPSGRGLLGGLGVVCLIAAIVLAVADGIGWTW